MSDFSINFQVSIGSVIPSPIPKSMAEVLESVEITRNSEGPSLFQINFHADRDKGFSNDYKILSSSLLKAFNRVLITLTLKGTSYILMDGFITFQELVHDKETGAATLTVTGEDVSVAMDIYEYSMEYPQLGDSLLAEIVLAKYSLIGIIPDVMITISGAIPITEEPDRYPQQNATDRSYLQQLAAPHGYIFYVKPGPVSLLNTAYWGPPQRSGELQKALSIDMGAATNVDKMIGTEPATYQRKSQNN